MTDVDPVVLQLYLNSVEMADRVSSRRGTANSFFLAVQSGLTAVAAIGTGKSPELLDDFWAVSLLVGVGLMISGTWWMLLRSYRDLNRAKFVVINEIERIHLPVQPFTDEWTELKKDPVGGWRGRYAEFTTVERVVPCLFAIAYLTIGLRALLA
jgi:hypothetical protein